MGTVAVIAGAHRDRRREAARTAVIFKQLVGIEDQQAIMALEPEWMAVARLSDSARQTTSPELSRRNFILNDQLSLAPSHH